MCVSLLIRAITKKQKSDRIECMLWLIKKKKERNVLKDYEISTHIAALLAGISNTKHEHEAWTWSMIGAHKPSKEDCPIPMCCWQTTQGIKAQTQKVRFSWVDVSCFLTELAMFSLFLHTYKPCMSCQANKVSLNWNCFLIMVYDNTCANSLPSIKLQRWNWLRVSEGSGKQCSRKNSIQHPHSWFTCLHRANENKI